MTNSEGIWSSMAAQQMEKGPWTGSFPKPQPTGALAPEAALPSPQPFWGMKCHKIGLVLSFFILFLFAVPERALAH